MVAALAAADEQRQAVWSIVHGGQGVTPGGESGSDPLHGRHAAHPPPQPVWPNDGVEVQPGEQRRESGPHSALEQLMDELAEQPQAQEQLGFARAS